MYFKRLFYLTDKVPELPYFLVAFAWVLSNPESGYAHVFSMGFVFMMVSSLVGVLLKLLLKTSRPKPYACRYPVVKYGFPSLHSMISIGALAFVYYINPWLTVLLLPIGLFYVYARLTGGYHTKKDILGGVALGLILGAWVGSLIDEVFLPDDVEVVFAFLFFIFPACASIARIREWV